MERETDREKCEKRDKEKGARREAGEEGCARREAEKNEKKL